MKALQEGDYCPECDIRQASGHPKHMPKCIRAEEVTVIKRPQAPYRNGSITHQVHLIFQRDKLVYTSNIVEELAKEGLDRKNVYQAMNQLKAKGLITQPSIPGGAGFWELVDASNNVPV